MKPILVLCLMATITLFSFQSKAADIFGGEPDSTIETDVDGAQIFESNDRILVMLDGSSITSMAQIHTILAKALHLPQYYGKNLDALYDVLTDSKVIKKNWDITIYCGNYLRQNIGDTNVDSLLDVLNDAQDQNHYNTVMYWQ